VTLVRLTDDNLTYLKRVLRANQPSAKTSHIAEALGQAFGRSTYAALLAATKGQSSISAPLARLDATALLARLAALGPVAATQGLSERLSALELPDPCWKEFPEKDLAANNAWYASCRAQNIPNICIRVRRKYAEMAWDCISLDSRYEHATHGKPGSALAKRMFETFQSRARGRPGKPIYLGSAFVGTVDPVDLELARQLADDYFEILYNVTRTIKAVA
jgi:hypothetical protein